SPSRRHRDLPFFRHPSSLRLPFYGTHRVAPRQTTPPCSASLTGVPANPLSSFTLTAFTLPYLRTQSLTIIATLSCLIQSRTLVREQSCSIGSSCVIIYSLISTSIRATQISPSASFSPQVLQEPPATGTINILEHPHPITTTPNRHWIGKNVRHARAHMHYVAIAFK
ncbi:hypothetical protein EDB83DRAFT_1849376, partial [Lactarius deliciosus]